jgi:hypothetical protein
MIHFLKFTRLTKLTEFGWPCLAKASAEPANFSEFSEFSKLRLALRWFEARLKPE